jgi:hypothetical protein
MVTTGSLYDIVSNRSKLFRTLLHKKSTIPVRVQIFLKRNNYFILARFVVCLSEETSASLTKNLYEPVRLGKPDNVVKQALAGREKGAIAENRKGQSQTCPL